MKAILLSGLNFINSITVGDIVIAMVFIVVLFGLITLVKTSFAKEPQKRKQAIN